MHPICTHKIGVQSKKSSHAYPVIRLPREFRRLAGAAAAIYETTHNGALAFLVVPHHKPKRSSYGAPITKSRLDMAEVGRSNRLEPTVFCLFSVGLLSQFFKMSLLSLSIVDSMAERRDLMLFRFPVNKVSYTSC
jgi:hypothetical protein